jgi:hypothetical protein
MSSIQAEKRVSSGNPFCIYTPGLVDFHRMLQVVPLKFQRGLAGLFPEQPDEIGIVFVAQVQRDLADGVPGMDQHAFGLQYDLFGDEIGYGLV